MPFQSSGIKNNSQKITSPSQLFFVLVVLNATVSQFFSLGMKKWAKSYAFFAHFLKL